MTFNVKGTHNFTHFCYIHIVEIPTLRRESTHEHVQSCPSNEKRELYTDYTAFLRGSKYMNLKTFIIWKMNIFLCFKAMFRLPKYSIELGDNVLTFLCINVELSLWLFVYLVTDRYCRSTERVDREVTAGGTSYPPN